MGPPGNAVNDFLPVFTPKGLNLKAQGCVPATLGGNGERSADMSLRSTTGYTSYGGVNFSNAAFCSASMFVSTMISVSRASFSVSPE